MGRRQVCCCCRRLRRRINHYGLCRDCAVCLHCERRPAVSERGLCPRCENNPYIQVLYRRSAHWSPEWEMHLRRKTAQVQRELRRLVQARSFGMYAAPDFACIATAK